MGPLKGVVQLSTLVLAHSGSRRYRQPDSMKELESVSGFPGKYGEGLMRLGE